MAPILHCPFPPLSSITHLVLRFPIPSDIPVLTQAFLLPSLLIRKHKSSPITAMLIPLQLPSPREACAHPPMPGHPAFPRGFLRPRRLLSALPGSCSTHTPLSPVPTLFIPSALPVVLPVLELRAGGEWQSPNPAGASWDCPARLPAPATTPRFLISPSEPRINYLAAHRMHREHPIHAELRLWLAAAPGGRRLHPRAPHTSFCVVINGSLSSLPRNTECWLVDESGSRRNRFLLEARGGWWECWESLGRDPCSVLHPRGWRQGQPGLAKATGTVALVLLHVSRNWELVTTLGRFTQNPSGFLGSSIEGECWSRRGWEPSPRVQPHCLGGPMVGTGMGMEQILEQPRHLHQASLGVPSAARPGRGSEVLGEGDKGGSGTRHPQVTLKGDPVEAGTGSCRVRVGRLQAPARGLTLKKKKVYLFQDLPFFFFSSFFVVFTCISKKVGQKVQKKSVAERQRFRNHSAERTQARNTEHEPNTPTTRPNYYWNFFFLFVFLCTKHTKACHGAGRDTAAGGGCGCGGSPAPAPGPAPPLTSGCSGGN